MALRQTGAVVAWGASGSPTNVPARAAGAVAIAAGYAHALALKPDGTVVAWDRFGEIGVPLSVTNVMAIAAGNGHSLALKNDGPVIAWGANTYGQTDVITNLAGVKLLAAGADFSLASVFSDWLDYPVDVSKDLLLIYNTNSVDSRTVCYYYLTNRPLVSSANVLGVGCTTNSTSLTPEFEGSFAPQIRSRLSFPAIRPNGPAMLSCSQTCRSV